MQNIIWLCSLNPKLSYLFYSICRILQYRVFRLWTDRLHYFFIGLECVSQSFAYVLHFVFLRGAWIRTQRTAVASRRANNVATHFPIVYIIILQDITELAVLWTLDQAAIPTTLISTASRKHKIHEIKPTWFSAEINLACELRHCLAGHRSPVVRPTFREYWMIYWGPGFIAVVCFGHGGSIERHATSGLCDWIKCWNIVGGNQLLHLLAQHQRYTEITHDPLLFSVAQGICWLSTERLSCSTLHLKEGERGVGTLVLCSLATDVLYQRLGGDSDKIPEGGTFTYILHLAMQHTQTRWREGEGVGGGR